MIPKISICVSYYRRGDLLSRTLDSICSSCIRNDIEIIIANDDVSENHLDSIVEKYEKLFYRIVKINTDRTRPNRNQNKALNIAVKNATSDKIIIQSAEVMHVGDISKDMVSLLDNNKHNKPYYCVTCMSLSEKDNEYLSKTKDKWNGNSSLLRQKFINHPQYVGPKHQRPFFFCAGMMKEDFINVGGFDERIEHIGYDDDLFVFHLKCNDFDIQIIPPVDYFALHQYHSRSSQSSIDGQRAAAIAFNTYKNIVDRVTSGKEAPIANPHKVWGELNE